MASEDQESFRDLVNSVELVHIHLVDTRTKFDLERAGSSDTYEVKIKPSQFRSGFDSGQALMFAGIRFEVDVVEAQVKEAMAIASVFAEYMLVYSIPPNTKVTGGGVSLFAHRNATFNAWSFFRELAFSSIARTGMPGLTLPLLRLPNLPPASPPIVPATTKE